MINSKKTETPENERQVLNYEGNQMFFNRKKAGRIFGMAL